MFMLLVFGRYVEEEGGVLGLWLTYLICGLGAMPPTVSISPTLVHASNSALLFNWRIMPPHPPTPNTASCFPSGGALASYLSAPGSYTVSLGASGAIFGLFAVGVLSKLSLNPRKLLEAFVLGQFVVSQVLQVRPLAWCYALFSTHARQPVL